MFRSRPVVRRKLPLLSSVTPAKPELKMAGARTGLFGLLDGMTGLTPDGRVGGNHETGYPGLNWQLRARTRLFARGRRTAQEALGAQILINGRPVDSVTRAADLPVLTLFRTSIQ